MARRGVVLFSVLVFTALVVPPPTAATQVRYQSVEEMGSTAQRIVRGTVAAVRPYWNQDRTRILTETTVRVSDEFKGTGSGTVRIVQFGGVIDGIRMTVAGALDWKVGEDVVLFLEDSLPGRHRVTGFNQGKYAVELDPATGREFVHRAGAGSAELVGAPVDDLRSRMALPDLIRRATGETEGGR
jgi:hypothetical protein